MPLVGFQDLWVSGSRVYFKRDPIAGVVQPDIDLGTVISANPTFDIEEFECEDADGGRKKLIAKVLSKITENYDVELKNFSPDNQALLFVSDPPEAFVQAATPFDYEQFAHPGRLVGLLDSDESIVAAKRLYMVGDVLGVAESEANSGVPVPIESISTQTVQVTGDVTSYVTNGDSIILHGLTAPADDGVKTVNSVPVFNDPDTTFTVVETLADQGAGGGTMVPQAFAETTDWEEVNLDRGLIRIVDGGAIAAAQDITIVPLPAAIVDDDGIRLVKPQSLEGTIEGDISIVYSRDGFARESVREARVSIIPSASNITPDEFSTNTLSITVLSDETKDPEEGRLLNYKGDTPALS